MHDNMAVLRALTFMSPSNSAFKHPPLLDKGEVVNEGCLNCTRVISELQQCDSAWVGQLGPCPQRSHTTLSPP